MKVIKIGGSLSRSRAFADCLATIDRCKKQNIVVVPGGGPFADQVRRAQREWRFDDRSAHCMALLAMQQMALMIQALQPNWAIIPTVGDIATEKMSGNIVIWVPHIDELDGAGVPGNWDVTSDSLAAWLATQLQARELILIKSANIPQSLTIDRMQTLDIIDRAFHRFIKNANYKINIINQEQFDLLCSP